MYEQGFLPEDDGTPLGSAVSLGFHESQSRLWENTVGRSQAFWNKFYPELQAAFPGVLDDVSLAQFYKAINKVQPSLIRVEADEVTYNLHVLMRFELEKQLIEGTLAVKDLPDAWNAKVKEYLGIDVPSNAQGCLQDVHWSAGLIGYFPTYSVGTVLAAQLYDAALTQTPGLATDIENADYSRLLGWMRTNVHHPGRRFLPTELVEKSCNAPFSAEPYIAYLTTKYGAIYGA
jgi:carboxypeptidase Taq